jgi:hypothetical protein
MIISHRLTYNAAFSSIGQLFSQSASSLEKVRLTLFHLLHPSTVMILDRKGIPRPEYTMSTLSLLVSALSDHASIPALAATYIFRPKADILSH